jgi:DNA-binding transcriptional MerR regulator
MAEKLYYSMGEVADMLDVAPSLLRFWEKRFDCITPHKNKKGNRLFTPGDVRNLKTIYHLVKERGMTLAGAEKQLNARRGEIERDMEIAERLGSIRALLIEVRNELGGDGTVVDDTVTEEVEVVETPVAVEFTATVAVAPPILEPEPTFEPESKVEPEPEVKPESTPEPEVEVEIEPEQEPTPEISTLKYVEQTLF